MKLLITILCGLLACALCMTAVAQQQTPTPKHLMREDSAAVNALVLYPDSIRLHIFEACEYPAAIVSIASLQKTTSDAFAALIGGYSKNEQEDLWDLTRYPNLVSALAEGGKKSGEEIKTILADYPADIHATALKYGADYYDVIVKMDKLQSQTDSQFNQIIGDYPVETQTALQDLVQYPEIISLLNDHLSLTVRVGDRFRRNPERVIYKADSLHLALAEQNAKDAEAWKDNIEQNPDEATDLQSAAADYATQNGYSQEDVSAAPSEDEVSNYTCAPYSYWFGYPSWYPYSYWYPYPYWFDCGFYHTRSGRLVIIGTPSSYFTSWYFYSPERWHRYPNLCNAYITYSYKIRRSPVGTTVIVHNWVRDNRNYLPADFLDNPSRRPAVIRQVAQLNIDVRKQSGGRTVATAARDDFFQKNKSRYSLLNTEPRKKLKLQDVQPSVPQVIPQPVKQPPVRIAPLVERPVPTPQGSTTPPERGPAPARRSDVNPRQPAPSPPARAATPVEQPGKNSGEQTPRPAYNFNNINKAQEYHRNVWNQTQPVVQQQPRQTPRPQVQQPVRQEPRPQVQQPARQEPVTRTPPGKKRQ